MNLSTLCRTKYRIGIVVRIGIFLLLPFFSISQPTFIGMSSNPADNGTLGGPTVAVTPPGLMFPGDLVVMYAHYRGTGVTLSVSTTGGQSWTTETAPAGGGNQTFAVFWCRYNGTWGANPAVTVSGGGTLALSVVMYVYRPTTGSNSWAIHRAATNGSPTAAAVTITSFGSTTVPNTVTMAFWSSALANTWGTLAGAGWSKTGFTAPQYRNLQGTDQSHTAAYNIRATAGAVANVSQTQSVSTSTRTSIISWYELPPPANDLCSGAITLSSATSCVNTAGTLEGSTYTTIPTIGCGVIERNDVWYSFVAQTTNPTITLSSAPANSRLQLFSGNCAGLTSVACGNGSIAATGLTIGDTYYVRVYTNPNTPGTSLTFNICVTDPAPGNNACSSSVLLTSSTTCTNTAGTVYGATNEAPAINNPNCASGVTYDVWYRFVAQTTNPTITLSSIGSDFTNASLQLLSNNCGSTFTPLFCGGSILTADFLTPGTTYYIRVYSTGAAPTSGVNSTFNICVTDNVTPPPSNDECSGAINLPVFNSCSNNPGNMAGATPSSTPLGGLCTGPNAYDVWYRFVAANTSTTVTIGSLGANFTNSGIEVFSGSCGSLVSIACATGTTVTATPLIPGNTYFIRVYSRTAPPPNGHARFNICLTTTGLPVRFGNSYVNVSKKTSGGVVEPGDTLEIRMTINHTSGTFYNLRYVDNVPTNTAMLTGAGDRIRIITNEGLTYKQYTLAAGDDAATYIASPPLGQNNVRMNLAFGASSPGIPANNTATEYLSADGTMGSANNPRGGGGLLFATAFRVVVTGNIGDTINLNAGQFIYRSALDAGTETTLTATPFKIVISEPLNLCTNSIGVNNASEYGGTFGSGTTLNRNSDLTIPIAGYTFINEVNAYNGVGDGRYAIVKNISPRSGTVRDARRRNTCDSPSVLAFDDPYNCNNRMFGGFWFIDGDHSGTNNAAGNNPPSASTPASYMLMVNADYVASEVFRQSINNLCPNTYYEFSAWIRNICPTCGIDSTGAQFAGTPTAPTVGYPGVYPNLSFALNDVDYYNSGEVDTLGWLKKGFVFRTGPTQTSAVFSIRNNAQGGGGNDWVIDDIAVATCLPTMSYSPTINPNVCSGGTIVIADTISSFFNNYTTYKWQRSTNGGGSWTDITGVTTLPDTNYYVTSYTVPPASTNLADSGNLYRVVVATTPDNLVDPNCNISDGVTITLSVLNCGPVLAVDLLSFNGKLVESKGQVSWTTSLEDEPVVYIVERSTDGRNFIATGEVKGYYNGSNNNRYTFTDPVAVVDKIWYRLAIVTASGKKKYSSIIQLRTNLQDFELSNIANPFKSSLVFDITVAGSSAITAELMDMSGRTILSHKQLVYSGTNSISLNNAASLPAGIYTLRITNKDKFIIKRVVKNN
jgi:trimeric autotransporter adhesin